MVLLGPYNDLFGFFMIYRRSPPPVITRPAPTCVILPKMRALRINPAIVQSHITNTRQPLPQLTRPITRQHSTSPSSRSNNQLPSSRGGTGRSRVLAGIQEERDSRSGRETIMNSGSLGSAGRDPATAGDTAEKC